jgi:nucleoid-associated protein YgaU
MKLQTICILVLAVAVVGFVGNAVAQEEMTKEQWEQQLNQLTTQRNELTAKLKALTDEVSAKTTESASLDEAYKKCMDELYALVGSDAEKAAAYRSDIESAENTANTLTRLSDADLLERKSEVDELEATVNRLWEDKLSLIPEFWDRLTALNEKVKSLRDALARQVKVYTVGTWSRDRDCLWNISKKKDIYDNAWLWPKIWQGNRDQIKDPDIIQPGQKLKIPQGTEMTDEEKTAARRYYSRKAAAAAPAASAMPAQ